MEARADRGIYGRGAGQPCLTPDGLTFDLGGSFRHDFRLHSLDHSRDADDGARQDRYQSSPSNRYSYDLGAAYNYRLNLPRVTINLMPAYRYKQSYDSGRRSYYELEGSTAATWDIDRLASTKDALTQYIDLSNSYHSTLLNRTHIMAVELSGWHWNEQKRRNTSLVLNLPLRHTADRIDYQRAAIDTLARRRSLLFEPSLEFRIDNNWNGTSESHFRLNYQYTTATPDFVQTIGWRDDSTPLIVRLGNPDLSNEHKHEATAFYSHAQQPKQRYLNTTLRYTLWQNAFVQGMTYDVATGIRTYRPDGIDGNWNLNGNISYRLPLDKEKRINLSTNTTADYRNSVDLLALSSAKTSASATPTVSTASPPPEASNGRTPRATASKPSMPSPTATGSTAPRPSRGVSTSPAASPSITARATPTPVSTPPSPSGTPPSHAASSTVASTSSSKPSTSSTECPPTATR